MKPEQHQTVELTWRKRLRLSTMNDNDPSKGGLGCGEAEELAQT